MEEESQALLAAYYRNYLPFVSAFTVVFSIISFALFFLLILKQSIFRVL